MSERRDPHRLAELRSLALHECVAARILVDPSLVGRAQSTLERHVRVGALRPEYAERWKALLDRPTEALVRALTVDDESMRDLRQCTPFTFVVSPAERWAIWRATKERFDRGEAA